MLVGAAREVYEETGLVVRLGPPLGVQRYSVRKNGATVPKLVHYWSAEPVTDGIEFTPNNEVDAIGWLPVREARAQLSYPRDVELLENLESVVPAVATVVLLRHTPRSSARTGTGRTRRGRCPPRGRRWPSG